MTEFKISEKIHKKLDEEIEKEKKWSSFVDSLKAENNIDRLLQEYEPLAKDKRTSEEESRFNYILRIMENLDVEGYIKAEKDPYNRYLGYQCLFDIGTSNNIFFLLESMETDIDPENRNKIADILSSSEEPLDGERYVRKILEMVGSSKTKEDKLFEVIGSTFKKPDNIIRALKKVKEHYLPKKKFFVGHEFSEEKKEELRKAIDEALKEEGLENRLSPIYIDLVALSGDLLNRISDEIKKAEFGIFDLSKSSKKSLEEVPNPNVILEAGIARGHRKGFYILAKEGMNVGKVISNLKGEIYLEYKDSSEMKEELRRIFRNEKPSSESLS